MPAAKPKIGGLEWREAISPAAPVGFEFMPDILPDEPGHHVRDNPPDRRVGARQERAGQRLIVVENAGSNRLLEAEQLQRAGLPVSDSVPRHAAAALDLPFRGHVHREDSIRNDAGCTSADSTAAFPLEYIAPNTGNRLQQGQNSP